MIDCILTGFMTKMQCNALTLKQSQNKFDLIYFIRGTTRPGDAGTITNLQIVLNTEKNPYLKYLIDFVLGTTRPGYAGTLTNL